MAIARIWADRMEAGTRKFDDCPEKYKDNVIVCLKQDVVDGKITEERFTEITHIPYVPD